MATQKHKKFWQKFLHFCMPINQKTQLIKALTSIDSSRSYRRLPQNPKTGGFRGLCLPKNDFKTCSTLNFLKKHPDFGGLESY